MKKILFFSTLLALENIVEPTRIISPCRHSGSVPYPYPTKDIEKEQLLILTIQHNEEQ